MNTILTNIDISIIANEIMKTSKDTELIAYINDFCDSTFIKLICSNRKILNNLPRSVVQYYEEEILDNYKDVMFHCDVTNMALLGKLIERCKRDPLREMMAKDSLSKSPINAEVLHQNFSDFYTLPIVFNFTSKPLSDIFITQHINVPHLLNTGFFMVHTITKNLIKKINSISNDKNREWTYNSIALSIGEPYFSIEVDALIPCLNSFTTINLLKRYTFPSHYQRDLYKHVKRNNEELKVYLQTQDIPSWTLKKDIEHELLHHYLAHNKHCTDEILITFHKKYKDINWIYVNTKTNLLDYPKYAEYLIKADSKIIVEANVQLTCQRGLPIKNMKTLQKLDLSPNIIEEVMARRVSELDIGIHCDN